MRFGRLFSKSRQSFSKQSFPATPYFPRGMKTFLPIFNSEQLVSVIADNEEVTRYTAIQKALSTKDGETYFKTIVEQGKPSLPQWQSALSSPQKSIRTKAAIQLGWFFLAEGNNKDNIDSPREYFTIAKNTVMQSSDRNLTDYLPLIYDGLDLCAQAAEDWPSSEKLCEEAVEIIEERNGSRYHHNLLSPLCNLSFSLLQQDNTEQAMHCMDRARIIHSKSTEVTSSWNHLESLCAFILTQAGEPEYAIKILHDSLQQQRKIPTNKMTIYSKSGLLIDSSNLAIFLAEQGDDKNAQREIAACRFRQSTFDKIAPPIQQAILANHRTILLGETNQNELPIMVNSC